MGIEAGRVTWIIEANDSQFIRAVENAEKRAANFSRNLPTGSFDSWTKGLTANLNGLGTQITNLSATSQQAAISAGGSFNQIGISGVAMGNLVAGAIEKVVSTITGMAEHVLSSGFAFNSLKEQSTIAFTQMLGSVDLAKDHLADLFDLANKTPFESEGIIKASQRLQAMGFAAHDVIPTLTTVSDAVAGLGGNADVLNGVVTALGQIKSKGKASAEELLQLAERGIPAWEFLAKAIGKSIPEAMKLVSKGAVDADTTINAILKGMNEKFGGLSALQAKTWQGMLSTVSDVSKQVFGELTGPLFERARDSLGKITDFLPKLIPLAQEVGAEFNRWIEIFEPVGKELFNFFKQLSKSLTDSDKGFKNFRDGAEIMARVLSSGIANGLRTMTEGLKLADEWLGKVGGSVHNLIGFLNPLLGMLNLLGAAGNTFGFAPDREGENAWKSYNEQMKIARDQLRDMRKSQQAWQAAQDAFDPSKQANKLTDSLKKAKQTLSEMSPFLTERAIAGSPEAVKAVVDRFVDTIVNQLNKNKDRVGEVGESLSSMFIKRFEASLGGDKKNVFFDNIIDGLRAAAPEIDATMTSVVTSLKKSATELGVSLGEAGLRSEASMRSIADELRKAAGITDAMYKAMSKSQRQAFDVDMRDAVEIFILQLEKMKLKTQTSSVEQSIAIQKLFADYRGGVITTEQFLARLSGRVEDTTITAVKGMDDVGVAAKALSDRVSEAMTKIRGAMAETPAFQTQELFSGVASQIEELAARSGIAIEIIQDQFRNKLLVGVLAGVTGSQQALAALDATILNSQLTKLENVWGVPLGRAIEAILSQVGKLKTGIAKQVTAIGELLSSLPDALGGRTLNKWINTINQWINFATKLLNVLTDVFGLKLPKSIQDLLNILNGGAQSTSQIMKDMAANVEAIMKQMANEVVKIVRSMVTGVKEETAKLAQAGHVIASQFSSNFVGGMSSLPSGVEGILNQTGGILNQSIGIFTGWGGRIGQVVQTVLKSIGGFGTQVPIIMNATGFSALSFANQFTFAMNQAAASAENAAARTTVSMGRMNAAAQSGAAGLGKLAAGIGGVLAGAGMIANVFGSGMGRVQGGIQGALGGLTAGASIGFMFGGPAGAAIGSIIGAGAGAVLGILGGGKTALQKAQEALQLQQFKDGIKLSQQQVLQAIEQTKQSWLDTLDKARSLLESIQFYSKVPKLSFKQFFDDAKKLFTKMAELSQSFKGFANKEIKTAAENLGAGVELLSMLPTLFLAISQHLRVPDISFDEFFADADKLIDRLGEWASGIKKKIQKQIGKLGERVGPGVEVVPSLADAITSIFGMQDLPDEKLNVFERNFDRFIDRLGSIAQRANKGVLKAIEFLGEKAGAGVTFGSSVAALIKSIIETPDVTESEVDAFLGKAEMILNKTIEALLEIVIDGLARSKAVAEQATPIFSFLSGVGAGIKSAVEAALAETPDFSRLKQNIRGAIQTVIDLAIELNTEGVAAAGVFSEAGGKVMGFLGSVGGAMKSLSDIFGVQFDFAQVKAASRAMIEMVIDLARDMDGEGVAAASKYATAASAVVTFVKNIGDAFKSAKEAGSGAVQAALDLVSGQKLVVDRLDVIAKDLGPDAIALATTTATLISGVVDAVLKSLGLYNEISKAELVSSERWEAFLQSTVTMVSYLLAALKEVLRARDVSGQFLAASIDVKDNILSAVSKLGDAANALRGLSGGVIGGGLNVNLSSAVTAGAAPLSLVAPSSAGAQRSSSSPAVNYGHTYQHFGDMYFDGSPADPATQARFERIAERLFERILDEADRDQIGGSRR